MDLRRARSDEDKAARRTDIVDAARATLDSRELSEFTMDAVAAELNLAKGTLYRYFPTREGLLLGVLDDDVRDWFTAVSADLDHAHGASAVTAALVDSLLARPRLVQLLAVLPMVLEHNVPYATALEFKTVLLRGSDAVGTRIDTALGASPGAGAHLLVLLNAGLIGLHHGAHAAPLVAEVLALPEFEPLRVDLRSELTHLTCALIGAIDTKDPTS